MTEEQLKRIMRSYPKPELPASFTARVIGELPEPSEQRQRVPRALMFFWFAIIAASLAVLWNLGAFAYAWLFLVPISLWSAAFPKKLSHCLHWAIPLLR